MKELFLCADLGGSRIKLGAFSKEAQGQLQEKQVFDVGDTHTSNDWLQFLEQHIMALLQKYPQVVQVAGLAMAYAGPVNCREKRLLPSNGKYLHASELSLSRWAAQWTDNFIVDNDARLACVGEWQYGAGREYDNLVCVTLGTGIGTSVILGGRVLRGHHDLAGCLGGHFTVDLGLNSKWGKQRCSCGNIGCVEALVSTDRFDELQNHFIAAEHRVHSFHEVFEAARQSQLGFVELQEFITSVWGAALVNYIHAYNPQIIVLSGGIMSDNGAYLIDILQAYTDRYAWQPYEKVRLYQGYADEAALYGGLYLLQQGEANVTI